MAARGVKSARLGARGGVCSAVNREAACKQQGADHSAEEEQHGPLFRLCYFSAEQDDPKLQRLLPVRVS